MICIKWYKMSYTIVAVDEQYGISRNGEIPWSNTSWGKEDITYFKNMTTGHAVIMGWSTFKSIGHLLPNRLNIIVTKQHASDCPPSDDITCKVFQDMDEAVVWGRKWELKEGKRCYVIGGEQIYAYYMKRYNPIQEFITVMPGDYGCDKFYPRRKPNATAAAVTKPTYLTLTHRSVVEEMKYLDLFRQVIDHGHIKSDRTKTGTLSLFSPSELKFSLENGTLPVLTTKTVALKTGVIPELLWFISGSTDTRILETQGCNIWKGNTTRDFLDRRGLNYQEKDMGPGYGFQWRHSGAEYRGMDADYTGQGVDQLQQLITLLREDPDSRRMIMCSWVAPYLDQMALPPCHILYQLYTHIGADGKRYLSAKMYQRSADSFLGVPFNITSYGLLTHIIAELTGCVAHELVLTFGDYHVYTNHLDQVRQQLERHPRAFPKIQFKRNLNGDDITNVKSTDFEIVGYSSCGTIAAPMAI